MFDHCLYFNTTALARCVEHQWADAFSPFGLTPAQAFLLRAVLQKPGLRQRELAREMAVARPTATRALDILERKKLIKRLSSAEDGRESIIWPTQAAQEIANELNDASGRVTTHLNRVLGRQRFLDTVRHVREARQAID